MTTRSSLRILQLYPKADYFTGAAIQLRDLAIGLAARGHAVTVVTPPSELWAERMRAADVGYVPVPMQRAWDVRAAWRLAKVIRAGRIQVAHAHKGRARTLALLAGLMGARSKLVLNRGVSFHVPRARRLGYTSRRVHAIVAVCESIKRDLVATGVPAQKIEVIYSGTDVGRFHPGLDGGPIRRELGLAPEHVLITQIGVRSWRGSRRGRPALVCSSSGRRRRASRRSGNARASAGSRVACSCSATAKTSPRS